MLDRIQELLRVRELSSSQFADAIGVSRPVVSHILSGRNKPSLEVVQKVIAAFPDLSLSWLLNGAGPMLERPAGAAASAKGSLPPAPILPPGSVAPRAQPATKPDTTTAPAVALALAPEAMSPEAAAEPVEAPKMLVQPGPAPPAAPTATPAEADLAYALADPGKSIRRIVLFYQDGTFTDFRPETGV